MTPVHSYTKNAKPGVRVCQSQMCYKQPISLPLISTSLKSITDTQVFILPELFWSFSPQVVLLSPVSAPGEMAESSSKLQESTLSDDFAFQGSGGGKHVTALTDAVANRFTLVRKAFLIKLMLNVPYMMSEWGKSNSASKGQKMAEIYSQYYRDCYKLQNILDFQHKNTPKLSLMKNSHYISVEL